LRAILRPLYPLAVLLLTWSMPAFADDVQTLRADLDREKQAREALEKRIVQVSGFVHLDWVVHRQTSQDELTQDGQPLNEDRFTLRRARLRGERDLGYFHGAVEMDANTVSGLQVRPIDAEATFKWPARQAYARAPWAIDPTGATKQVSGDGTIPPSEPLTKYDGPWFMVTGGLFRTPFGFEVQEPERLRPFLERSTMSNALFPQSFDLGLRVLGGYRMARWSFAVMNGDPIGEKNFPGRDPNKSKDLVFRIGAASDLLPGIRLEGGISGLTGQGFHKGSPATADQIQWQDQNTDGNVNAIGEITVVPGSPAVPSQNFKRFAVGADVRASIAIPVLGDLDLRAEIVRASNLDRGLLPSDPITATRDQRQTGVYFGVTQELTKWALIGVRWDTYNPDADAREQEPFALVPRDPSVKTWAFNLTGRWGPARLVAQYDKRSNTSGRDANGRPTTLADDSLTLRAEVRF
jgi:hypothetical protein